MLAIGILIITLLSSIVFLLADRIGIKDKKIYSLFFIALFIHLSAAIFIFYTNFYPFGGGAGDQLKYHQIALELSARFKQGNFSIEGFDKIYPAFYVPHFYPVFLAILYALTAPSIFIGISLNVWFAALSIAFLYLIVKEIGGSSNNAFLVGLIAAVYPSYLYFSSLLIRDAILVCFTLLALLFLIKIVKNFYWNKILILSLSIGIVLHLRFYIGIILLFVLSVSWFLTNLDKKEKIKYGIFILIVLGIFPQIFSGQGYFGLNFFQTFLNGENTNSLEEMVSNSDVANTSSFFSIFLGPFPWHIKYSRQLFVLIETIPWCFLLVLIIISAIAYLKKKNYKPILPLVIFAFAIFLALSSFLDNFGTYMRIRIPGFLALLALADFSCLKQKIKINVFSIFKSK